jgi:tRNA(Arg) A34 adenosine deaminase TadA
MVVPTTEGLPAETAAMSEIPRQCGGERDEVRDEDDNEKRNPVLETYFMRQALYVAEKALEIGEVPVGCVIVLRDVADIEATSSSPPPHRSIRASSDNAYDASPSVIVSHGSNQVNATRDATRHAELVAIDRMLTRGSSSDQMKLPPDIICRAAHGKIPPAYSSPDKIKKDGDYWINVPRCKDHWKNSFGWGSGRIHDKEILRKCDLYVTCEPCIMVRGNHIFYLFWVNYEFVLFTRLLPYVIVCSGAVDYGNKQGIFWLQER